MYLQANNIHKKYGDLEVLKGVDIAIEKGSFNAIKGASGAGKSTLLHILGTLDKPDAGNVLIDDTAVFTLPKNAQASFRNKYMGFVFQFHHLLPEFTALENVCMPLWIHNIPKKEAVDKATQLLEKVGLGHRLQHKPSQLSGGEQQRVAIARALIQNPGIVFADEPTGNLDTDNAKEIHQLFLQLKDEFGITLVVVTHNEELAKLADRVIEMKDGIIINDSSIGNS